MDANKERILDWLERTHPEFETIEHMGQLTIIVPKDDIIKVAEELAETPETLFDMLIDITAIDWNKPGNRFEVVYFLYSNRYQTRLRLKTRIDGENPVCPSVCEVWENANWYERETYDMYGIVFKGHPNLRRFYMPEDFKDPATDEPLHPLRKDFPLMGVPESTPLPPYPEKFGEIKD